MKNENLDIIKRLIEIAKNPLDYSTFPKPFKEEHIFLSNELSEALKYRQREFDEYFQKCVGNYKSTLENEGKGYGWFHSPEKLIWKHTYVNQLHYIIYGDRYTDRELVFREELKTDAYKDLILQVSGIALMTDEELVIHNEKSNELVKSIMEEILAEEKLKKQ